jgi:Thioredoxin
MNIRMPIRVSLILAVVQLLVQDKALGFAPQKSFGKRKMSAALAFQSDAASKSTEAQTTPLITVSPYSLKCGAPGTTTLKRTIPLDPRPFPVRGPVVPNLHTFSSPKLFLDALDSSELIVIQYYAPGCKICQSTSIDFKKIAVDMPQLQFARVDASQWWKASDLYALGLTRLPFVQIYRSGTCVASFSTGPSHVFGRKVRGAISQCLTRNDWAAFEAMYANEMAQNVKVRATLRENLDDLSLLHP